MTVEEFFDHVITVRMREDRSSLDIIDQTLLPGTIKRINLNTKEEIWEAIKKLRVRGAPAIGAAAAYGIALLASGIAEDQYDAFYSRFKELKDYLASSRPTAVNLFWALNRMEAAVVANSEKDVAAIKELLFEEADKIREEDVGISRGIGEIGFGLLKELKKEGKEIGILTHCNAGTLATAKYGTATAPMYIALEKGWPGTDMGQLRRPCILPWKRAGREQTCMFTVMRQGRFSRAPASPPLNCTMRVSPPPFSATIWRPY